MDQESGIIYSIKNVKIDQTKYDGIDQYSDGDIEAELLDIVKNNRIEEALQTDNRWPILYHLSDKRQNILSWLPLTKDDTVLEIGSGCGALTGMLCRKAGKVETVEISPRRAKIAAWKNQTCDNLTIHVGNLNDMDFEEKFDYVTLIGVLEYAGSFTHTDQPYIDFIESCKKYLKQDGVLVIAIENRLGMKYWAGAAEDHTGRIFDGIEDYSDSKGIRTFARQELKEILDMTGLSNQRWYYPYPDYKFPIDLYTDSMLPTKQQLTRCNNKNFDRERYEFFSEKKALVGMLDAGLFPEFANSFCVCCRQDHSDWKTMPEYVHYAEFRNDLYRISTMILDQNGKKVVRKVALTEKAKEHLRGIEENGQILAAAYGVDHILPARRIRDDCLEFDYLDGMTFSDLLVQLLRESGIQGIIKGIQFYCQNILIGENGSDNQQSLPFFKAENRKYNIDISFDNIIVKDGTFIIYDYEWLLEHATSRYILYRSFRGFCFSYYELLQEYGISFESLLEAAGINQESMAALAANENVFFQEVEDMAMLRYEKKRLTVF